VPFGAAAQEDLELQGEFSLYALAASPLVFTTQHLQYRNRLLDRILQTEVAPAYAATILGEEWESRLEGFSVTGRVVVDATLPSGVTHRVRLLGERREPVVFEFRAGDPRGVPTGDKSALRLSLRMRDAPGADATAVPVYYDLLFGDGSSARYAASDGRVVSCTTAAGRRVTPADAGLEAEVLNSYKASNIVDAINALKECISSIPGVSNSMDIQFKTQVIGKPHIECDCKKQTAYYHFYIQSFIHIKALGKKYVISNSTEPIHKESKMIYNPCCVVSKP
jgi:hypothetical protein